MSKKAAKPANVETTIQTWFANNFTLQIYAAIKDISATWTEEHPYPEIKYESYDNLRKSKEDRMEVSKVFTLSQEFRKLGCTLVNMFVAELEEVDAAQNDTMETLIEKIRALGRPSLVIMMKKIITELLPNCGKTLSDSAADADKAFGEIIYGLLPSQWQSYGNTFRGRLTDFFIDFMKCIAFTLATQKWYTGKSIMAEDVIVILAVNGLKDKLDEIRGEIVVEKKPVKPRVKKEAKDAPAAVSTPAAPPAPTSTPTPAVVSAALSDILKESM